MTDSPELLTVVYQFTGGLDREAAIYRQLLASSLRHEDEFELKPVESDLSTSDIIELLSKIDSKYVVFVQDSHLLGPNYLGAMLDYLQRRNVYIAEPFMFTGAIPKKVAETKTTQDYFFKRDTDIYGAVYHTRRLREFFEAVNNIDRSSVYVSYRLYWNIQNIAPLPVGYSVSTNTKAAIGHILDASATRLFPLIKSSSLELRIYIIRSLAHYLRGLRSTGRSSISARHISELTTMFSLEQLIRLVKPLQPFEAAWIESFIVPKDIGFLYKNLTSVDAYLVFEEAIKEREDSVLLYTIKFSDRSTFISKVYRPTSLRQSNNDPSVYDHYSKKITPESVLIFFDRPMQADDNAEYLYEYFVANYPEYKNSYFALNPKSEDWSRLEQKGFNLIPIFTTEFYEMFLESDLVVSSQIYNLQYQGKNLGNSRFVYLQHGVQLNDMSDWVNSKFFDVFVATGKPEEEYLAKYAPYETLNSGLPRLESLIRKSTNQKQLLFLPTWRFNLNNSSTENFIRSEYFQAINGPLTNKELLEHLEANNATLQVKLHPNVAVRSSLFSFSERVIKTEASYRDAITMSDFVFTDYSSAVLDASFIGIPIAYYPWDIKTFFKEQPYESRLDYKEQGLGPVFDSEDEIVQHIISFEYEKYNDEFDERKRIFFEGVDPKRINAKIVDKMLGL
ncbi:CDP-glycerol glycerophosphotransferase family protein [Glutamicibacter halophytocola]|uniref:CDP-glycerol glycerophosphotransferase family protein n=1 Tax=Glutamicibacter halophytocola TaxID=1933880 RepID=UPI00321B42EF